MANLWRIAREWMHTQNPQRNSPQPKISSVLDILQTQEEAKDHVYYDALRRISASKDERTTNGSCAQYSALPNITEEDEKRSSHSRRSFVVRSVHSIKESIQKRLRSERLVLDPEDDFYYLWMGAVAATVIYNLWSVILRIAFTETTEAESFSRFLFWWGDLFADGLYTCDICVQLRTAYRDEHGIMVKDPVKLTEKYCKKGRFKVDIICLLPLESLSTLIVSPCHVNLLRLPRLLKWHSVETFFLMSDYRTSKPNRLRAFKLILYLSVAMHWVACLYYTISEYEGLGSNEWVYTETEQGGDHFTRKYVKSFYWSVLTLMTIGETPSPQTNIEYIFTGCMFLLGIFVFATVVGNVGDVISNMNAARTNFQARMDSIKQFMEHHNVPHTLQTRVKRWAHYAWSRTQALEEGLTSLEMLTERLRTEISISLLPDRIGIRNVPVLQETWRLSRLLSQHAGTQALEEGTSLEMLPERLRTEIAIHVHLDTLRKVKIFKDCEQGLLCELVLKLRPQIFSPGDYICRSGEIGREMYIINNGRVEVVITDSATAEEVVVASLTEGNCFGEISLLRLDEGKNRRSADVRSVGYSELLCLSQKDLMEALEEYPDAKKVLESQGRDRSEETPKKNLLGYKSDQKLLQRTRLDSDSNSNLSVVRPGEPSKEKLHDLEYNFAREINGIKKLLEELKESKEEFTKHGSTQNLKEECLYLRAQVQKQRKELSRIKQYISPQTRSPTGEKRRHKSGEAQNGEKLIQRVILAAKRASENLKTSQEIQSKQVKEQRDEFEHKPERKKAFVPEDVPELYVENDIDGLCYIGGPSRKSLKDDDNKNQEVES